MSNADAIKEFAGMLKAGDHQGAADKFNSPEIVSIEAMEGPMARVQGTEALKAKSAWWYDNHTVHGMGSEGPFVNGGQFAMIFDMDVTAKASGQRIAGKEIGIYTGYYYWLEKAPNATTQKRGLQIAGPFFDGEDIIISTDRLPCSK